jgi:hypothetical protein
MPSIKKAPDLYDRPEEGVPYVDATTIIELKRKAGAVVPDPAAEQEGDPEVTARVDHGRWVGDCGLWDDATGRTCLNTQAVDPDDERFFCVACNNDAVEGRWRPVAWPADVAAVEATLDELDAPEQNWPPSSGGGPDPDPPIQGEN